MAELIFRYGTMASGKSLHLLATAHNFKENRIRYQLLKPAIDTRSEGTIHSRIGVEQPCTVVQYSDNLNNFVDPLVEWLLIDEAQFLSEEQVNQLIGLVDNLNINVVCYGLKTDYLTRLFEGSKRLLEVADRIEELPSYCECGEKASVNARFDSNGDIDVFSGNQIEIGGDEKYKAMCRKCFFDSIFSRNDSTTVDEQ